MEPDESATERDCVTLVNAEATSEVSGYFSRLTQVWIGLAYGRQLPGGI